MQIQLVFVSELNDIFSVINEIPIQKHYNYDKRTPNFTSHTLNNQVLFINTFEYKPNCVYH